MPQVLEQTRTETFLPSQTDDYMSPYYAGIYYPVEHEEKEMGETSYHIKLITNFLQILLNFFHQRDDVFLSANMNIYYEENNPFRWYAPDLLIAFGVPNVERSSYLLIREKVFPQIVFEVASEKTWRNDVEEKLRFYDIYGAEEYYIFDPEFAYLPEPMMAFHRRGGRLVKMEIANDRIFSPLLGLEIVQDEGKFRLFNQNTREFLLTLEESEADKQRIKQEAKTEIERLKAEIERLKASK